jgi:hypothetical protein
MSEQDLLRLISQQLEALRKDVQDYQLETSERLAKIETKLEPVIESSKDHADRIDSLEDYRTSAKTSTAIISGVGLIVSCVIGWAKSFFHF